jgi:hypothetical protein
MDDLTLHNMHMKAYLWAEKVAGKNWKQIDILFRKRFVKLILHECRKELYPHNIDAINTIFKKFTKGKAT